MRELLKWMQEQAPEWLAGCKLRICTFEPTFQKHAGKFCQGFQIHVDDKTYGHEVFKPYRLIALWLKAIRTIQPEVNIWRSFAYEYEQERLAIDLINGGPDLREWVENPKASCDEFDERLLKDERAWAETRAPYLLYS